MSLMLVEVEWDQTGGGRVLLLSFAGVAPRSRGICDIRESMSWSVFPLVWGV